MPPGYPGGYGGYPPPGYPPPRYQPGAQEGYGDYGAPPPDGDPQFRPRRRPEQEAPRPPARGNPDPSVVARQEAYNRAIVQLQQQHNQGVVALQAEFNQHRISRAQMDAGVADLERQYNAGVAAQQRALPR
jgi:hypothetical protein